MLSASNPYSTHVPGSMSKASRSRTVNFSSECCRATASGPPMELARVLRPSRSVTSGRQSWTSPTAGEDGLAPDGFLVLSVTNASSHALRLGFAVSQSEARLGYRARHCEERLGEHRPPEPAHRPADIGVPRVVWQGALRRTSSEERLPNLHCSIGSRSSC